MSNKPSAIVTSEQTVSEAFETIFRHNFNYLLEWEQAARSWEENTRGLHQIRVALRRMRSALFIFRSAISRGVSKKWSKELRYLAGQLGMARDLDVLIDEGLGAVQGKLTLRGQKKFTALVYQHREEAYKQVHQLLDGDRYITFKTDFSAWLDGKEWENGALKKKCRKNLSLNIIPYSDRTLRRLEHHTLGACHLVDKSSAEEMHLLRIKFKKLRYAAEFFAPALEGLDEFIVHTKQLQDLLGLMNDVSVMQRLLERMLIGKTDYELIEYAGGLVGWRTCQYHQVLDTFDDRLEELVNVRYSR